MFAIGDKIKLNEELCPENKRDGSDPKFAFGALNYMAIMLAWEGEVVKIFEDEHTGTMVEMTITNDDRTRSNIVVRAEDMVLASKQGKMDLMNVEIIGKVNKNQAKIDLMKKEEAILVAARKKKKLEGSKITDKVLIKNWEELRSLRGRIKTLEDTTTDLVYRVKHGKKFYDLDCKEADIKRTLRRTIQLERRETKKTVSTVKKTSASSLNYSMLGGVMTKAGTFLELNEKYAMAVIKEHKKPKVAENHVGIEIEMISPKSIDAMNKEFCKARVHRYVNVGTDASIRVDSDNGNAMELRICLPESQIETQLKVICEILRKNGCYANRSCGMHVHLDMRNRDPELCYRNFFKVQDIMLQVQPEARRNNRYCMPNTEAKKTLKQFKADGNDTRRLAINTDSYYKNDMRTIEIRIHEGATKFKDVYNWTQFLVATASLKNDLPTVVKTTKQLKELNYLSDKVLAHLEERVEEYSA